MTHFDDYSNWVGSQQVINERQFAAGDSQRNLHVALRAGTHHVISRFISFCTAATSVNATPQVTQTKGTDTIESLL